MTDEKQDLENLLLHPGWQRFVEHAKADITTRLENAMENAANNEADTLVANQLRQCVAVRQSVRQILAWPETRYKVLHAKAQQAEELVVDWSRRGRE